MPDQKPQDINGFNVLHGRLRYLRVLKDTLPPREAKRILEAFAGAATRAEVLAELQVLGVDIPNRAAATVFTTASATRPPTTTADGGTTAPGKLPGPASAGSAPTGPAPTTPITPVPTGTRLTVFAHVAREADRLDANLAASGVGDEFPLAGVEYVAAWGARPREQGQVRYYKANQQAIAKTLADRLSQQTNGMRFTTVDLSPNYPNLPANRIEVWFPQFPPK